MVHALPDRSVAVASPAFLLLLVCFASLTQIAINIYLPGLPLLARELQATPLAGQLTLTMFLASYALSQLALGPMSDRWGRRPVLIGGLLLYIAASVACTLATSIELLLAERVLQGIGAGAGLVVGRAVSLDRFAGAELARVTAFVAIGQAVMPAIGPAIGGVLLDLTASWRSGFALTAALGLLVLAATLPGLPESNAAPLRSLGLRSLAEGYAEVLGDRVFMAAIGAVATGFGFWFGFFAGAPAYFIGERGMSPSSFGLLPAFPVAAYMLGNYAVGRLAKRIALERLAWIGVSLLLASGALALALPLAGITAVAPPIAAVSLGGLGLGLLAPPLSVLGMRRFQDRAGTASALVGCLAMGVAALSSALVGLVPAGPGLAYPIVMAGMAVLTALGALAMGRQP